MTGANVRHHLTILKKDGSVEVVEKKIEGKGRPVNIYGLTNRFLGSGIGILLEAMSRTWLDGLTGEEINKRMEKLAVSLAGNKMPEEPMLTARRFGLAIEHLNSLLYQARWEASAQGARVILGHCPYADIIERHPELCQMDAHLLQKQTGFSFNQTAKLVQNKAGLRQCVFVSK